MTGYFRLDRSGVLRPYINLDVEFQEPHNVTYNVTFAVDTRTINATLYLGSYWITMPIPIIDALPGPNTMPSLLGRDIIDEFALFMERRTDRVLFLDYAEVEEFINISG